MPEEILIKAALLQLIKMGWRYDHTNMQGTKIWSKNGQQFAVTRENLKNLPQE